jgi:hypothetical protein
MYYESTPHTLRPVADAVEAAKLVCSGSAMAHEAIQWSANGKTYYAVSDTHIDDGAFAETAIIRADGEKYTVLESITVAWCTLEKVSAYFLSCETQEWKLRQTQLIIGKPKPEQRAWFTCACCGNGFNDFVAIQLKFDHDAGYGICPRCQ